jgi:type I restriction enzyme S subunit
MRAFMQSRSSGTTVMHLKTSEVPSAPILLPPIYIQKRIVDLVSSVDDKIKALEKTVSKTRNLRSALLSDLLSGKNEIPSFYDKLISNT